MATIEEESVLQQAKMNWNANAELRQEFGHSFDRYKAYVLADARGQVKIHGKRSVRPDGYVLPRER